jgi:phosphatidylglycerophosphatase A
MEREMKEAVIAMLERRGVKVQDIAEIVLGLQKKFHPELSAEECTKSVLAVLGKREVQFSVMTGIALDEMAEKGLLEEPLLSIIKNDLSLYGIDEVLAMGIANIYGSIGITNFGYLDKEKPGIIGLIDCKQEKGEQINTFLDDIVAGITAAATARIAHQNAGIDED